MEETIDLLLRDGEHSIKLITIHQKALEILEAKIVAFGIPYAPTHIIMERMERSESITQLASNVLRIINQLKLKGHIAESEILQKSLSAYMSI